MLLSLISFELGIVLFICEFNCNIISAANSMYMMCIWLIYYDLGCDVYLPRSFVTLGGLPGLYKWKYVCANVLAWQPYLILYKLGGSIIADIRARLSIILSCT